MPAGPLSGGPGADAGAAAAERLPAAAGTAERLAAAAQGRVQRAELAAAASRAAGARVAPLVAAAVAAALVPAAPAAPAAVHHPETYLVGTGGVRVCCQSPFPASIVRHTTTGLMKRW